MQNPDLGAALASVLGPIVEKAIAEAMAAERPPEAETLLTRDECAAFLRISPRQLDILRKGEHRPPELRVGDSPRFLRSELIEWARGREK